MHAPTVPVSRIKVIVPARRPEILLRSRLLELLYELLDKKLILISAPAGYGKTSLLIDLARHLEIPLCWLSLDLLDQEPQRFIAYIVNAISQRFPKFGSQSTAALNSLTSVEEDLERMVVILANEIYDQVGEHFVLVLDDYHLVENAPAIQNFLNRFLQLVGENCHLILSARTLISLPDMPLMVARNQVDGLSFLELAFQAKEIQALFSQNYHLNISQSVAQELAEETEGWITGLQLSNLAMTHGMADRLRVARASGVGLFDYLGQQVLDQQPPLLRDFLLHSSLLGEFDADLCEEVLGPLSTEKHNWQELITSLQRNNLFVLPIGADGKWLRYHHLFNDFLQARLREEHPGQVEPILYRLAEVQEQRGEWEKAHQVYQEIGDLEGLADLVERAGTPLIQNGRLLTLNDWLERLPPRLRETRTELISLQGTLAYMRGDLNQGLLLLNQAEASFRTSGDIHRLARSLVRRAVAYRFLGNYKAALTDAEEVLQMTVGNTSLEAIRAEAQRIKGLSLYRLGKASQAIEWLQRSLDLFITLEESQNIPMLQMELGMAFRAVGDYKVAQDCYEKALKIWSKTGNLTWQANLFNNLGVLHHIQGEYEKAISAMEAGLKCANRSGYTRMEALILASLVDIYIDLGEYEAARSVHQQAEAITERIADPFLSCYLILAQAIIARLQKDFVLAKRLLPKAQILIDKSDSGYERGLLHLEKGRLALSEEDCRQAIVDLKEAELLFLRGGRELESIWSQIWLASALYQSGDKIAAQKKLQHILNSQKHRKNQHAFYRALTQARDRLSGLREDPIIGSVLSNRLEQATQTETNLKALRKRLRGITQRFPISPPQLKIQAFGRAQVRLNGKLVPPSLWQTQTVRDLFFYFLSTIEPVSKEQVGVVFWPEISSATLKMRFKNNIYRLRHALGQETILFENDLYSFNRALDYEYDVETFEAYLTRAATGQDIQERLACYQAAVDLVTGPYLLNVNTHWVWPERERMSKAYLSALITLAGLRQENGEPESALEACQRAIQWDGCYEEAHRLAMQIHNLLGDRAAIVRQYQNCQQALLDELDTTPSQETEKLYHNLVA